MPSRRKGTQPSTATPRPKKSWHYPLLLLALAVSALYTSQSQKSSIPTSRVTVNTDAAQQEFIEKHQNITINARPRLEQNLTKARTLNYTQQLSLFYNFTELVLEHNLSRTFAPFVASALYKKDTRNESWCASSIVQGSAMSSEQQPTGLLYNKMPKAASSTTAGIVLRIAKAFAERHFPDKSGAHHEENPCPARVGHVTGYKAGKAFGNRQRGGRSFLFSTIRDPMKRSMSRLYFTQISQGNRNGTDANIMDWLRTMTNSQYGAISPGMGGFQLAYLSLHEPIEKYSVWNEQDATKVQQPDLIHNTVRQIISDYDFILIVERFDECLVVIKMILGLERSDILYLKSKGAGDYFYNPRAKDCIRLTKAHISEAVADHFYSPEWYAQNYGDYILLEAAHQSLERTIDALGRERFDAELAEFLELKQLGEETCSDKAMFPCSHEGVVQLEESESSCYQKDAGCGAPCLDEMVSTRGDNRVQWK